MSAIAAFSGHDARSEPRDEVHHRARAMRGEGPAISLTVVNLSPHGLMARSDLPFESGDRVTVSLPVVGLVRAQVRWALGGRIGCQLDAAIPPLAYRDLIRALTA